MFFGEVGFIWTISGDSLELLIVLNLGVTPGSVQRTSYKILGIEQRPAMCKASTQLSVLSLWFYMCDFIKGLF